MAVGLSVCNKKLHQSQFYVTLRKEAFIYKTFKDLEVYLFTLSTAVEP